MHLYICTNIREENVILFLLVVHYDFVGYWMDIWAHISVYKTQFINKLIFIKKSIWDTNFFVSFGPHLYVIEIN